MKTIIYSLLFALFAFFIVHEHQEAWAYHNFFFRDAADITSGILDNARLDNSSVTKRGQMTDGLQALILSSLTVRGTITTTDTIVVSRLQFADGSIQQKSGGTDFFDYTIASASIFNADYVGTDQVPFIQASTTAHANGGGKILVRRGLYVFTAPVEISSNTTIEFEQGATLRNSGNLTVLSVSGTVVGATLNPIGNWAGTSFLRINSSGTADGVKCTTGSINTTTGQNKGLVMLTGSSAKLRNSYFENITLAGSASDQPLIIGLNCQNCSFTNNVINTTFDDGEIWIRESTGTSILGNQVYHNGTMAIMGKDSVDTFINGNSLFIYGGGTAGHGVVHNDQMIRTFVTSNDFIQRGALSATCVWDTSSRSSGTVVSNNYMTNFSGGVNTTGNNTFIHGNIFTGSTFLGDSGSNTKSRDNFVNGALATDD